MRSWRASPRNPFTSGKLRVVKWLVAGLGVVVLAGAGTNWFRLPESAQTTASAGSRWRAGEQLQVRGRVVRILTDDREGSPHQRFIIEADGGGTLLIAHNLNLAPRLAGLAVGEQVMVVGEYEWN